MAVNRSAEKKVVYRNVFTKATFIVVGKDAALRMDQFASWRREAVLSR